MNDSQAEIKAIQARLREIGRRSQHRTANVSSQLVSAEPNPSSATTTYRLCQSSRPQENWQSKFDLETPTLHLPDIKAYAAATPAMTSVAKPSQTTNLNDSTAREYVRSPILPKPLSKSPSSPPQSMSTAKRHTTRPSSADLGRLEAQVHRINQLSAVQEAAMLELKAIAEQLEHSPNASVDNGQETDHSSQSHLSLCEYLPTAVPTIERDRTSGTYVVTARSINLLQKEQEAEQEAALTAAALRQFSRRTKADNPSPKFSERSSRSSAQSALDLLRLLHPATHLVTRWLSQVLTLRPTRSERRSQTLAPDVAAEPSFTIQDAALWTIGAIAARIGIDMLLAAFPHLWLLVVAIVVAPAAIAIYQSMLNPKAGFKLGYRLLLIMIGLLLGGRL
jgi:hypothetical protein